MKCMLYNKLYKYCILGTIDWQNYQSAEQFGLVEANNQYTVVEHVCSVVVFHHPTVSSASFVHLSCMSDTVTHNYNDTTKKGFFTHESTNFTFIGPYCSASEFRHPVKFVTCHLNPQKPAILVLNNMQPQLVILICNSAMEIKCKYGLILSWNAGDELHWVTKFTGWAVQTNFPSKWYWYVVCEMTTVVLWMTTVMLWSTLKSLIP